MEPATLGLVVDSSAVIAAERGKMTVPAFIQSILIAHGPVSLSLSPITVAELVHGIYRTKDPIVALRRRQFIEELIHLIPVYPITAQTGLLAGRIEGQEAAKGNVIPFNDLIIGVSAIEQNHAVLTLNARHFRMIPDLRVVTL